MSKYGVKIKKFQAGRLYEYILGVREFSYTKAMMINSLFLYYLQDNGLKTSKDGSTRDIISISFNEGSKSYENACRRVQKAIDKELELAQPDNNKINSLNNILDNIELHKDNFNEKSFEDIRIDWYKNGLTIEYRTQRKNGEMQIDSVHYNMLYRSTGAAKNGDCIFICDRLYKKAKNFLYMGLKMQKHNAPIVEMSAYISLITSAIVDTVTIKPENILVIKDIDSFMKTNVVSININENKECYAERLENYKLKNTLFDGQALIDNSIFPSWGNGYILLRHHMTKMAAFDSYIQKFFKDYFGEEYDMAEVQDMWGDWHKVKDIKMITTDNACKWLKFNISYDYWSQKVKENDYQFGIVKTAHRSKLGNVQKMSYQMINALDVDIINSVTAESQSYIQQLKTDDEVFLDYLEKNKNFSNDYEALIALCKQNKDFFRCDYFRSRRYEIIRAYVKKFKTGKVINEGDNLVIMGNPYAMLLHSVGEDVGKDTTFTTELNATQCYTERFKFNEYLAEFRNPFNSKNNMGYLHNVYDERLEKYFNIGEQCIAVNMIGTDFQDRNNGSDQDSDSIYTTNQSDIVKYAKYCVQNYPTIVNNIPKEKNHYDNIPEDFAKVDNNLAKSQLAIGESSNLAQLALSYTYNFDDRKFDDYVCILSVVAQAAIDNSKRSYDIDIPSEIRRIKKDMEIDKYGYPKFWKNIKSEFRHGKESKMNYELKCPMNSLDEIKIKRNRSKDKSLPIFYFMNDCDLKVNRRKSKRVEKMIEDFSLNVYQSQFTDTDDYLLLKDDFESLIERIRTTYISKEYVGLMTWLIKRAFEIDENFSYEQRKKIKNNKPLLLKVLYETNPKVFLQIFSKNA